MKYSPEAVGEINRVIYEALQDGRPFEKEVLSGARPLYLVSSVHPTVVERYGLLTNRSPVLQAGRYSLIGFMTESHKENLRHAYAILGPTVEPPYYALRTSPRTINDFALYVNMERPFSFEVQQQHAALDI